MGDILRGIFDVPRDERGRRLASTVKPVQVQDVPEDISITVPIPDTDTEMTVLLGVATPEAYDPSAHTVAEVLEYAAAHPDEVPAIIAAEQTGKARKMVLGLA